MSEQATNSKLMVFKANRKKILYELNMKNFETFRATGKESNELNEEIKFIQNFDKNTAVLPISTK